MFKISIPIAFIGCSVAPDLLAVAMTRDTVPLPYIFRLIWINVLWNSILSILYILSSSCLVVIIVNGAVMTNTGNKAMHFSLENDAAVMRERDILLPDNVETPLQNVYLYVYWICADLLCKVGFIPIYIYRAYSVCGGPQLGTLGLGSTKRNI